MNSDPGNLAAAEDLCWTALPDSSRRVILAILSRVLEQRVQEASPTPTIPDES